jgi:predicted metalloendopeptidase
MTHGFDDIGREYDANGNRNGWWSPRVISQFKEHAACIEDMFSSFSVYGHHINGKLTLGKFFFTFFFRFLCMVTTSIEGFRLVRV